MKIYLFFANALNHFELALYSTLAPILLTVAGLGSVGDPGAMMSGAAVFYGLYWASAMLAYPLGAAVFARISQLRGSRWSLLVSLGGAFLFTALFAFLPPYAFWGVFSGLFLFFARAGQCFCAQGQRFVARFSVLDSAPVGKRITVSAHYEIFSLVGHFLASLLAGWALIKGVDGQWLSLPWRAMYFFAAAGNGVLFWALLRYPKDTFDPLFAEKRPEKKTKMFSGLSWRASVKMFSALIPVMILASFVYVPYACAFQVLNIWVPSISTLTSKHLMLSNSAFLLIDMAVMFIIAPLLNRYVLPRSRLKPARLVGAMTLILGLWALMGVLGFLLILQQKTMLSVALFRGFSVITGVTYALLFSLWLYEQKRDGVSLMQLAWAQSLGLLILGRSSSFFMFSLRKLLAPFLGDAMAIAIYPCALAAVGVLSLSYIEHIKKAKRQSSDASFADSDLKTI